MFHPLLMLSLTATMATADFTTTMDFRDWLIGEESIGRESPFGFQGSIVNIDQNKTTIHAVFDQDSGDLSTKYHHANNTNSFTFTLAPNYISAQIAKPDASATTRDVNCSGREDGADNTCTISLWGQAFSGAYCADGAFGVFSSTRSSWFCENGTQTNTWTDRAEHVTSQRRQVVLTAGLEKLGAQATEATLTPTGTAASASATVSGPPRETGGVGAVRVADVAMVWVGAAVAVAMV